MLKKQGKRLDFFDSALILMLIVFGDLGVQFIAALLIEVLGYLHVDMIVANYLAMALLQICFAIIVFLFLYLRRSPLESFPFNAKKRDKRLIGLDIIIGISLALICLLTFYQPAALFETGLWKVGYNLGSDAFVVTSDGVTVFLIILDTCILAPLVEETVFRGVLLSGMRNDIGKWPTILLNGLAFSLFHMNPDQTVYQFFLGCICAMAAYESRSLLPGIAIHFTNNFLAVLMVVFVGFEQFFSGFMNFFLTPIGMIFILPLAAAGAVGCYFIVRFYRSDKAVAMNGQDPGEAEDTDVVPNETSGSCENVSAYNVEYPSNVANGIAIDIENEFNDASYNVYLNMMKDDAKKKRKKRGIIIFAAVLLFCAAMWLMSFALGIFMGG